MSRRSALSSPFAAVRLPLAGALFALGACAPARTTPTTTPSPVPARPTTPAPGAPLPTGRETPVPAVTADEPPQDWHLLDLAADGFAGISLRRAERELLAGRRPQRSVLVAVIDGGIDTAHVDLRANLWSNPRETGGGDGDGDGLRGDVRGWNFVGGRDGRNVNQDTYEVTRLQARCDSGSVRGDSLKTFCPKVTAEYGETRANAEREAAQIQQIATAMDVAMRSLRQVLHDTISVRTVRALQPTMPQLQQARDLYLRLAANGITPQAIAEAKESVENRLRYGLNTSFNPRPIVGDDYANPSERTYGNADVMGPDAKHGTHVSGIIAAVRGNDAGIDGIAPSGTRLLTIRTVPDGDERDKDIANAIRYAVDHGAHIMNMSFGKGWSPQKGVVDDAVKYAESKGVLLDPRGRQRRRGPDEEAELPDAVLRGRGARAELDRGRRVVVEGGRQARGALLELRGGPGRSVRARSGDLLDGA